VLRGRVWVALHMHAGDGNVHTNIPVNSDNYAMLQTAHEAVARIMKLARQLDGVISGEHGIGITKLEFLRRGTGQPFTDYKRRVDPKAASTRASCRRPQAAAEAASAHGGTRLAAARRRARSATCHAADLTNAYTPASA
jgi:hypothetical protein